MVVVLVNNEIWHNWFLLVWGLSVFVYQSQVIKNIIFLCNLYLTVPLPTLFSFRWKAPNPSWIRKFCEQSYQHGLNIELKSVSKQLMRYLLPNCTVLKMQCDLLNFWLLWIISQLSKMKTYCNMVWNKFSNDLRCLLSHTQTSFHSRLTVVLILSESQRREETCVKTLCFCGTVSRFQMFKTDCHDILINFALSLIADNVFYSLAFPTLWDMSFPSLFLRKISS